MYPIFIILTLADDDSKIVINANYIMSMGIARRTSDDTEATIVLLSNGKKWIVQESIPEIMQLVSEFAL